MPKTGGSDGLVGELLKYGGSGMVNLLHQLFCGLACGVSTPTVERGTYS